MVLSKVMRRSIRAMGWLLMAALVAGLMASPGHAPAQVPGSDKVRASARVLQRLQAGQPQDVVVEFSQAGVEEVVRALRSRTGVRADHESLVNERAQRYRALKAGLQPQLHNAEASVITEYSHLPLSHVRLRSARALQALLAQPGVVAVHEVRIEHKSLAESLPMVGQNVAASVGYLGAGTSVAILDTGVDYTRSAFGSCTSPGAPASTCKVVAARDFAAEDGSLDDDGHGTNVAAIALGVAPGTKIIALDVFSPPDVLGHIGAPNTVVVAAINWVVANKSTYNIVAINMSLGSGQYKAADSNGLYNVAVANARAAGIVTVAAAGNDGYKDAIASPAATPGVVAVGAVYDAFVGERSWGVPLRCTDRTTAPDQVTCFSNSSSLLTVLAPGSVITAAGIVESGTSQASPHVAGAVAVLRAAYPAETVEQTIARLRNGTPVTDAANDITRPRLNLPLALGLSGSCSYALSEPSHAFAAAGGTATVTVTAAPGCTWSASAASGSGPWITVNSSGTVSGSGAISYTIAANPSSFARSGALSIAGQTLVVTQPGSSANSVNILANPNFESGSAGWTQFASNGVALITQYDQPSATNAWYAWLCGYDSCQDRLHQDLSIPADALTARLNFDYWISSTEPATTTAYDTMTVRVYSPPTASTYTTLWSVSNLNAGSAMQASPGFDLGAWRGRSIRLQFVAGTDILNTTSFFLDNVYLTVTGAAPDTQLPSVPLSLSAQAVDATHVSLVWTASSDNVGVTAYKVYRDGQLKATLGNLTKYTDSGLVASTRYVYAVSACDLAGNCSQTGTPAAVTTPGTFVDTQAPTAPLGLSAVVTGTSTVQLSWLAASDNVGVSGYRIYRNGALSAVLGAVTSYVDSGLTPLTAYGYAVSACDAAGNCSPQSTLASATTNNPLQNLSSLKFVGTSQYQTQGSTVTISVDKIANQSSTYRSGSLRLELWALQGPYLGGQVTGYVTASTRTSAVSGLSDQLAANSSFTTIRLTLPYTAPPSGWSTYVLFLTEYAPASCSQADGFCIIDYLPYHESQKPTVPIGLVGAAIGATQVGLAWNPSSDASGIGSYRVFRNGVLAASLGNVTGFVDAGLQASTSYSYTLAACDTVGNCSDASAPVTVLTAPVPDLQPPSVPTGLAAVAVSSTHVLLSWNASVDNVGVTAYKVYSGSSLVGTLGPVTSSMRLNAPASSYSYSVAACDAAGNCSTRTVEVAVTTPAAPGATAGTARLTIPWITNASSYVTRLVMANDADSDASYSISLLAEPGNVVSTNSSLMSGTLKARTESIINISDLIRSTTGNPSVGLVMTVTGVVDGVSGVYNIVNPVTGSISNTSMVKADAAAPSVWVLPTFSTSTATGNRFIFTNSGSAAMTLSLSPLSPGGTSATVRQASWSVPARSQLVVNTTDFVQLGGGQQAGVVLRVAGTASDFAGVYQTVNTATGSVSNTSFMAPSATSSASVRLLVPWFSINRDYDSRFFLVNRGALPAAYSVAVYAEPGNALAQTGRTGVIPAGGQVQILASDIVTGFVSAPRGGIVFTVNGSESDIDGVYQISNPSTGSVSNSQLIRPSTLVASATRLSVPWFSINPDYVSRFVFMNRSSVPVPVGVTVRPEGNNSAVQIADSFVIPANSLYVLPASSVVSSFNGAPRASISFNVAAPPSVVDGLYNIVNPSTGSISNTLMLRSLPD